MKTSPTLVLSISLPLFPFLLNPLSFTPFPFLVARLSANGVGDEGAVALCEGLRRNNTLLELQWVQIRLSWLFTAICMFVRFCIKASACNAMNICLKKKERKSTLDFYYILRTLSLHFFFVCQSDDFLHVHLLSNSRFLFPPFSSSSSSQALKKWNRRCRCCRAGPYVALKLNTAVACVSADETIFFFE